MSQQYVYVMKSLSKTFPGGREILKNIHLSFFPGAKIGIIGQNGSGKTTLLKIMAGLDNDFQGEAWPAKGTKVGYLPQEPQLDNSKTVAENIEDGLGEIKDLLKKFDEVSARFADELSDDEMNALIEEQAELQENIDAVDGWGIDRTIEIAMDALGCPPGDSAVAHLSGGEKRRVALCKLLLQKPDILLLDEPTNHLDADSVAWLEKHLQEYAGTVVLVTHDRYFLDNVVGWILEIDRGEGIPYEGNYSNWLEQKQKRLQVEQKHESSRQRELAKELDWIRQTPKGRQSKSKARIAAYEKLLNQNYDSGKGPGSISIPPGPRLGSKVIEVDGISMGFDDRLLIDELTFKLPPGGIVGIIGPNGAGKSTLFNLITNEYSPHSGTIALGDTVKLGYVNQNRDLLDGDKTIWEEISDGQEEVQLGKRTMSSRAYCGMFNFKGTDQQKPIKSLSGGERNRVHLAKVLKSGANVILLDEPTNDLDIETLRSLEDALLDFAGCALIISHDRFFLDKIATHILSYEGEGEVVWYEGNYQSYEEDRKRRLGITGVEPRKFKYKPLTR